MRFFYLFFSLLCLSIPDGIEASSSQTHEKGCVYLDESIIKAAESRDRFYNRLGMRSSSDIRNFLKNNFEKCRNRVSKFEYRDNPWSLFLSGNLQSIASSLDSDQYYKKACDAARNDPGITWVLFNEFYKTGNSAWAQECLDRLEKIFLESGASSVKAISLPLLYLHHTDADRDKGIDYFSNSIRFDNAPFSHYIYKLFNQKDFSLTASAGLLKKITKLLAGSWPLQLGTSYTVYKFFRTALFIFIIIFYILCFVKYSAPSLHFITHLFPLAIPQRLKISFIFIITISTIPVTGILPFLLITGGYLYFYLKAFYKKIMFLCLLLIALSPFESRITSMFVHSLDRTGPVFCFNRAVTEGPSGCLLDQTMSNMKRYPDKPLPYSAASLIYLKLNRPHDALPYLKKALSMSSSDPVVLNLAGIINSRLDNNGKAVKYYEECIEKFPSYEITYFNLGQLKISMMETNSGGDLVSKATEKNEPLISAFLQKNSKFFPGTWPALRQFIIPDYKPFYFFVNIFPGCNGSWEEADKVWGAAFFGVPAFISQIIFMLLLFSVIITDYLISRKKHVKSIYQCPLCGMPMCRLCRTEQGCLDCLKEMTVVSDGMIDSGRENRIVSHAAKVRKTTSTILNCLMPGCGSIYYHNVKTLFFLQIIFTSIVYACYANIVNFYSFYPYWTVKKPVSIIFILCAFYSLSFLIYYGALYLNNTVKKEDVYAD